MEKRHTETDGVVDPVLDQLVFLAKFFGKSANPQQMVGSIPLPQGRVTIAELDECSRRAGMSLQTLEIKPEAVKASMLPALLTTAEGEAIAVLNRKDDLLEIRLAGSPGTQWVPVDYISGHLGECAWFVARPLFNFDERSLIYHVPETARWFWDTLKSNRWIYGWALVGTIIVNLAAAVIPFFTMSVYDRVVPNNSVDSLKVLVIAVLAVIVMDFIMKNMRSYLVDSAARKADIVLSSRIFSKTLKLRAENRPASGGVLANIVRDFDAVRDFFASTSLSLLGDLPFMFLFLGLIALIGGWLVLIPMLIIPLALGVSFLMKKPLGRVLDENTQDSSQRTALLFEVMNGLDTVKSLGADAWARRKWEMLTVKLSGNSVKLRKLTSFSNYFTASLTSLTTVLLVSSGALLITQGELSMGQLIAISMLSGRAIAPVAQLSSLIVRWQQTKLSLHALNQIMEAPSDEAENALYLPHLDGKVELRDLKFSYPESPPLLKGLNLTISPGEKVAFIGRIGSGKSSVLRLLLNTYRPTEGAVLVDDVSVGQIDPQCLRRHVGYVPQDVVLFHGDIRENIVMGATDVSDEDIVNAIKIAGLDESLSQMPDGLSTPVGERGERLSGGQRQTVAVARALVRKPKLLFLDEPSSAMDPATEQNLIRNLRALEDTTLILITHRTAMLPLVDRLVVFANGQIVMDGPREEVMHLLTQDVQRPRLNPRSDDAGSPPDESPKTSGCAPASLSVVSGRG